MPCPGDWCLVSMHLRCVALQVGTGCTVFVENTLGFSDHVVWNPWDAVPSFPNFVCVQPAAAATPVKLMPVCFCPCGVLRLSAPFTASLGDG